MSSAGTGKKRQRQRDGGKIAQVVKSADELRLESMLFGASHVSSSSNKNSSSSSSSSSSSVLTKAIKASAPTGSTTTTTTSTKTSDSPGKNNKASVTIAGAGATAAAWHDEDDDELQIDIASSTRLRKLRTGQDETHVSGAAFTERLKQQFARTSGIQGKQTNTNNSSTATSEAPRWAKSARELREERKKNKKAKQKTNKKGDDDDDRSSNDDDDEESVADDSDNEDDSDEEIEKILRGTESLVEGASSRTNNTSSSSSLLLPASTLGISRLRDANIVDPSKSVIQSCEFHPIGGSIMFTASLDHRIRFFAIDGKKNSRLASVYLPDLPVATACWTGDGSEVICTGRRPFFYTYDVNGGKATRIPRIMMGKEEKSLESAVVSPGTPSDATSSIAFLASNGNTILCSARTKQWIGNLKMDGTVRAACFSRGSTEGGMGAGALDYPELLTGGSGGEVYRWCLRTMKCLVKHADEGSTGITAIASPGASSSHYAVGSTSGVVNIYNTLNTMNNSNSNHRGLFAASTSVLPERTIMNITTSIDSLRYTADGSILALSSRQVVDSLKLYHTQSGTVFSNWPTDRTPLHYVTTASFSPGGGYLTIGNDRGRVLLYRLHHFPIA